MSNSRDGEAGDSDELMRRWRARIAVERATAPRPGGALPPLQACDPSGQALSLRQAGALADVGRSLPPFAHLGPVRRAVARLAGRVILYFLRLVTVDQQRFNRLVVEILAAHGGRSEALDAQLGALGQQLEGLSGELAALRTALAAARPAIEAHDARLSAVEGELAGTAAHVAAQAAAREHDGAGMAELRERVVLLQA